MLRKTVVITGPGGVGKSPLDALFRDEVIRIDPYRLRQNGPRGEGDKLYAPPRLHDDLKRVLVTLGDQEQQIACQNGTIEWFPRSKVLFFTVRDVWQCLLLSNVQFTNTDPAKAEMYIPVLVALLNGCNDVKSLLGDIQIIILNPVGESLKAMAEPWKELKDAISQNCINRGDSNDSVLNRMHSIDIEAPVWQSLIGKPGVTECVGWPFAEYCYPQDERYRVARASVLVQARQRLLRDEPSLGVFFKTEREILSIR